MGLELVKSILKLKSWFSNLLILPKRIEGKKFFKKDLLAELILAKW